MLAAFIAVIVPPVATQLGDLIENLPTLYERAQSYLTAALRPLFAAPHGAAKARRAGARGSRSGSTSPPYLVSQLQGLLKSGADLFNSLALLFLTPVITFFLLRDWDKMIASLWGFLPRQQAPAIAEVAREIDSTISAYLRGTLIVLLIVSVFYMVSLGLIGLNYGLLIGLAAGLLSFVPYLGSTGGFLVSGGVALSQYWPDYTMVALVCGVFVFGQVIEGNVLTPYIVGNSVRLHPALAALRLGRVRLSPGLPRAAHLGAARRHHRRSGAIRDPQVL